MTSMQHSAIATVVAAIVSAMALSASAQTVILVDFRDRDSTPTAGGTWNELGNLNTRTLNANDGSGSGISIAFGANWATGAASGEAADNPGSFWFNDTSGAGGDAASDGFALVPNSAAGSNPATFTLSGFSAGDTVTIELVGLDNNARRGDYTVDGSFGDNGQRYNNRLAWSGGKFITWAGLSGSPSYTFSLDENSNNLGDAPRVSAMRITIVGGSGTPSILLSDRHILEHMAIGTDVGSLSVENGSGSYSYSLPPAAFDNALFDLTGTDNSNLVTDAIFDYETLNIYTVRVVAVQGGDTLTNDVEILIDNANDPAVALDGNIVSDRAAVGTVVGNLSMDAPIVGYTFGYTMGGGADDGGFTIDGTQLKTAQAFDYETKDVYNVKVVGTIQEGGVSGDGPGAGPFTNDLTVFVSTKSMKVILVDFNDADATPTAIGTWNELAGTAPVSLIRVDGVASGRSITFGANWNANGTSGENADNPGGAWFNDTANAGGDAAADAFELVPDGAAGSNPAVFTLSGFMRGDVVRVELVGLDNTARRGDYTVDGSFGDNGNTHSSRSAWSLGTFITWSGLEGSTSYQFLLDEDSNYLGDAPLVSAMRISYVPQAQGTVFIIR